MDALSECYYHGVPHAVVVSIEHQCGCKDPREERENMRSELIVRLGLLLIFTAVAPAWADTYTFNWANECYLRSGDAYSTCFSGATGNAPSAGLYEETQTASGGGIVITRLAGTTGTYVNQWAQNTNNTIELTPANGFWETGSFDIPVG